MKVSQLHRRKRPGRVEEPPLFTPEQAAANRELFMQQLEEAGLAEAANEYFVSFKTGRGHFRSWLIPDVENVREDLKDVHVDHILKNWSYYKQELSRVKELQKDDVSWL